MKSIGLLTLSFALLLSSPASADWRWAKPTLKKQTVRYSCNTMKCIRQSYLREKKRYERRVARYDKRRLKEWKHWTSLYIPQCTWYGESGTGPQFARYRYTLPNSQGSGAFGKYQFMPGTYHNFAKYHDWSPLDQEIAGHRTYHAQGTGPWSAC